MRNIWVICRKELNSYFVSPVAYLLLTMFAIIFGFFFWNSVGYFNAASLQSQMSGQAMPMSVNEYVIRPLLSNISVVGLFFIPMITMRLFAEEKRMGTIELLATSPIRDIEVIIGKWLSALILYGVLLLFSAINFSFLFRYGNPDWKPLAIGYLGLLLQAGGLLAIGTFISNHRRRRYFRRVPVVMGSGVGIGIRNGDVGQSAGVFLRHHAFRFLFQRRSRHQGRRLLRFLDFHGAVSNIALYGIAPVEVVNG